VCDSYDGAVSLLGHFEDTTTIYIVQEHCAKVCLLCVRVCTTHTKGLGASGMCVSACVCRASALAF
jgi:hypothetical protein